jgi:hypothetical protein
MYSKYGMTYDRIRCTSPSSACGSHTLFININVQAAIKKNITKVAPTIYLLLSLLRDTELYGALLLKVDYGIVF